MNINPLNKLMVAAGLAASVTLSVQAGISYDWNDGTMQGWENTRISSTSTGYMDAWFGPAQTYGRDNWGAGYNSDKHVPGYTEHGGSDITLAEGSVGNYFLGIMPWEAQRGGTDWQAYPNPSQGVHKTIVTQSPRFTLEAGALTYIGAGTAGSAGPIIASMSTLPDLAGTWGPQNPDGAPEGTIPTYPGNETRGNGQVSLMDDNGNFVFSKQFTLDNWSKYTWTAEELAPFIGGNYRLVLIDQCSGNSNYVLDNVTIPGTLAVPEPSTFALLGLGGLALLFRRRK